MTDDLVVPHRARGQGSALAVALVGFMGAGKTTVGRELASRLGWRFKDLDGLIEQRERRVIAEIFQQDGEPAFRLLELSLLRELVESVKRASVVLALGGGAFAQLSVQKCLDEASIPVVFLDAPVGELFMRSEQPEVVRPLRRDPAQFRSLYEQRRPAYFKATVRIDTSAKDADSVAVEIISKLQLKPASGVSE